MALIQNFGGIFPRTSEHTLPDNAATIAHNVKLRNGRIEAWRDTEVVTNVGAGMLSFAMLDCCALAWPVCVSVANYVVDYDRWFVTGRNLYPEILKLDNCTPSYYRLGVPMPVTPPFISTPAQTGRDCDSRAYVYTYENIFGEESAPSLPSNFLTFRDGQAVTITNFSTPPPEYNVAAINIYRSETAFRDGSEKEQQIITDYLYVATIPIGSSSYLDTALIKNLGHVCSTREVRPPPDNLRQIRYLKGTGVLTGVTNNMVHFSTPFMPHSWPADQDLTLPHNIVNAVTLDRYLFVSTDSYPYVIDGGPSCEPRKCRAVTDVDTPLPDIGCGYVHSAISTPFGMVYSSKDGLVLVSPDAKFRVITSAWFGTDEWVKLRPDTARLAYWRGYIFCVTDAISFALEVDGETYSDFSLGALTTISDTPVDMITTDSGELLMLIGSTIYQWAAGAELRPYIWESRQFNFGGNSSPTSAKVKSNDTRMSLMSPIDYLFYTRHVINEKPFRLGRLGRHLNYRVRLEGTGSVEYVSIGTSEMTLLQGT